MTAREIWADYDDEGIVVYQAFKPSIAAAAVVITIPIIIFVLFFQRRIVAGLTSGAVKG